MKKHAICLFDVMDSSSNPPLAKLFFIFFLFKSHITLEMHLISIKNEGNNLKVENKVSGRVRVGVGRALLSQ